MEAVLLVGDSYSDQDLFYKTGFLAGDPFIYLETGGQSRLVTGAMEAGRARLQSSVTDVRSFEDYGYLDLVRQLGDRTRAFNRLLSRIVKDAGVDQLLVGPAFAALYADSLRGDGFRVEVDPKLFIRQRRTKSPQQVDAIEHSQDAAQRATAHAIDIIAGSDIVGDLLVWQGIPLTSERLRGEVEVFLTRLGMDTAHQPIVAGGPGAAEPHWIGEGPLRPGEAIVLDIFPRDKSTRYWGDITRTVVHGEPDERLREMFAATLQAQEAALAQIRAGANGRDVHRAVQQVFEECGFAGDGPGPRLTHGTGHGVGLDIHEAPTLSTTDVELMPGDVITVEPGLYDGSLGAVRIEDTVVVTDDGYRNLTNLEKRFEV